MKSLLRSLGAVATVGASALLFAAPAQAARFDVNVGGIGFSYNTGGYCDGDGCPREFWNSPVYYCPVFYKGDWYRGPLYYRPEYDGSRSYWVKGGWHRESRMPYRPQWACTDRMGPPLGLDFYVQSGFNVRPQWRGEWQQNRQQFDSSQRDWMRGHQDWRPGGEPSWYRQANTPAANGFARGNNRNNIDNRRNDSGGNDNGRNNNDRGGDRFNQQGPQQNDENNWNPGHRNRFNNNSANPSPDEVYRQRMEAIQRGYGPNPNAPSQNGGAPDNGATAGGSMSGPSDDHGHHHDHGGATTPPAASAPTVTPKPVTPTKAAVPATPSKVTTLPAPPKKTTPATPPKVTTTPVTPKPATPATPAPKPAKPVTPPATTTPATPPTPPAGSPPSGDTSGHHQDHSGSGTPPDPNDPNAHHHDHSGDTGSTPPDPNDPNAHHHHHDDNGATGGDTTTPH